LEASRDLARRDRVRPHAGGGEVSPSRALESADDLGVPERLEDDDASDGSGLAAKLLARHPVRQRLRDLRGLVERHEKRWPSFERFVSMYALLTSLCPSKSGTRSTTERPKPSSPTIFLGLFERSFILWTPRRRRICAPTQ